MSKLERAMQYKYKGQSYNQQAVSVLKDANYPYNFKDASDAVHKIEKYDKKSRERSVSKERIGRQKLKRYKSNECLITASLKQQMNRNLLNKPQSREGRQRSNSSLSQNRFKMSEFTQEVGK
jgi:hypothetical protein